MTHFQGVGAYKSTQVKTVTNQKELIVMAYDGILRFLAAARDHMERREIEPCHERLVRARDILEELAGSLNMAEGGQIAKNLWNLYVFFMQKITEANLTKDPSHLDAIVPSIRDLREAWVSLEIPKSDTRTQALNHRVPADDEAHRLSVAG